MTVSRFTLSLLLAVTIAACSGLVREEVLMPVKATGMTSEMYPTYDLSGARLIIYPTLISEELQALFAPLTVIPTPGSEVKFIDAPLSVDIYLYVDEGNVVLNPDTFSVRINDTDFYYPERTELQHIVHKDTGRSEYNWEAVTGERTFPARGPPYRVSFKFGAPRQEVQSFVFFIGHLSVDGHQIRVEPVRFERQFRSMPR